MTADRNIVIQSLKIPHSELQFRTSRSGGPGGQNVNKLETRVELLFNITWSPSIPEHLKSRLLKNLSSQIDSLGNVRIVVQESRSQWMNKQLAIDKLTAILKSGLAIPKRRIPTKKTKTAQEKRLSTKKARSEIKKLRKFELE